MREIKDCPSGEGHRFNFDRVRMGGPSQNRKMYAPCDREGCKELITLDETLTKLVERAGRDHSRIDEIQRRLERAEDLLEPVK